MNYVNKHIVKAYSNLFEGLSSSSKIELIEILSKSLREDNSSKATKFYKSFGAFSSTKSAEEIIDDVKLSRKFRKKELKF